MMYVDFNAGTKQYQLRINTRNIVALEKQLGCNPLSIFGDGSRIPTVTEMVTILHAALQQRHHGMSLNDAYNIFDDYLAENPATDFIPVILEIYKASGLIRMEDDEEAEKN